MISELHNSQLNEVYGGSFSSGEAAGEQLGKEFGKALVADQLIYAALKFLKFI